MSCREDLPAMRLLAEADREKGGVLAEQAPLIFLQTPSSRQFAFCCMFCGRHLGDLDAQLLRAKGLLQRPSDFLANVRQRCNNWSNSIIICPRRGCKHGYCSDECLVSDNVSNGHWLVCAGGTRQESNLTRAFLTHATKTNDLFTAGLSVVAKLVSITIDLAAAAATATTSAASVSNQSTARTAAAATAVVAAAAGTSAVDDVAAVTVDGNTSDEHHVKDADIVMKVLERVLSDFESQYPCRSQIWEKSPQSEEKAGAIDDGSTGKSGRRDVKNKKRKRRNDVELNNEEEKSSEFVDKEDKDEGEEEEEDDEEEEEDDKSSPMSDVLEQQALESWTLLQLLLKHEKNTAPRSFTSSSGSSGARRDIHGSIIDAVTSGLRGVAPEAYREAEDCRNLLSNIGLHTANILTFKRWANLLGSLNAYLVPLQVDSPLNDVAKNLPNLPHWEDRKNILSAFECFAENGGADSSIDKSAALQTFPSFARSSSSQSMGDTTCRLIATERCVVRLAQAATLLSSSSSPSSSSSSTQVKGEKQVGGSTFVPTENPFSRVAFLAMALVPFIGTNIGPYIGPPSLDPLDRMDTAVKGINGGVNGTNRGVKGINRGFGIDINKSNQNILYAHQNVLHTNNILPPPRSCFVTHSCVPNAQLQGFIGVNGLTARLVALRDVQEGAMIQCSAIEHSNQILEVRTKQLQDAYPDMIHAGHVCECERCTFERDPDYHMNREGAREGTSEDDIENSDGLSRRRLSYHQLSILADQSMQEGRTAAAISLYAATVLRLEEEYKECHTRRNSGRREGRGDGVIVSEDITDVMVIEMKTDVMESREENVEENNEYSEGNRDDIELFNRLDNAYHSLGASLLDYKSSSGGNPISHWREAHRVWLMGDKRQKERQMERQEQLDRRDKRDKRDERDEINERDGRDERGGRGAEIETNNNRCLKGGINTVQCMQAREVEQRDTDQPLSSQVVKLVAYDYDGTISNHTGNHIRNSSDTQEEIVTELTVEKNSDERRGTTEICRNICENIADSCYMAELPPSISSTHQALKESHKLRVYLTKESIVSAEECSLTIQWAEEHASGRSSSSSSDSSSSSLSSSGWTTGRHYAVPTTDIPIHTMPPFLSWFNNLMRTRLGPLVRGQFLGGRGRIAVHDAFIVKYRHTPYVPTVTTPSSSGHLPCSSAGTSTDTPISSVLKSAPSSPLHCPAAGTPSSAPTSVFDCLHTSSLSSQRHLPLHTDESTHSLTIALNHLGEYEGGGTYFAALDAAVRPDVGQVLSFPGGDMVHGGDPLLSGVRYIIAVFLFLEKGQEGGEEGGVEGGEEGREEGGDEYVKDMTMDGGVGSANGVNNRLLMLENREDKSEDDAFLRSYLSMIEEDPLFSPPIAEPPITIEKTEKPEKLSIYNPPTEQSAFSFGFGF